MSTTTEKKPIQLETDNVTEVNLMGMVHALMAVKNAVPATFIATTEVKMNKTNNPYFGRVTKKQKSNVFINFDYTASVNRKLVKEGKVADFVALPRKWGIKLPGTSLILHEGKGKYYLECRFLGNEPQVEYYLDNVLTDKSVFELFIPAKNEDSIAEHQGLEEKITIRDVTVDNIMQLRVNGTTYVRNDI